MLDRKSGGKIATHEKRRNDFSWINLLGERVQPERLELSNF
jgi:hypothetical protein